MLQKFEVFDTQDVSWANINEDADMDDDDDVRIKEVAAVPRRPSGIARMATMETWDVPAVSIIKPTSEILAHLCPLLAGGFAWRQRARHRA